MIRSEEVIVMKRIVLTNNGRVADMAAYEAEINYRQTSAVDLFREARKIAARGGRLMIDPTRISAKKYFRSLPFIIYGTEPDEKSIHLIDKVLRKMGEFPERFERIPVTAGLQQDRDLNAVMKALG